MNLFFLGLILPVILLGTALWLWMLVDCALRETADNQDRLVWVLIIIFTWSLGALLYLIFRRPRRIAELGA